MNLTRDEILNMPAGREIDVLVAEWVMGWPTITENHPYTTYRERGGVIVEGRYGVVPQIFNGSGTVPDDWYPSSDIVHAWGMVEKLRKKGICLSIDNSGSSGKLWEAHLSKGSDVWWAQADAAPLAICRAALLVLVWGVKGGRYQ